jgi:hypothetical protein
MDQMPGVPLHECLADPMAIDWAAFFASEQEFLSGGGDAPAGEGPLGVEGCLLK